MNVHDDRGGNSGAEMSDGAVESDGGDFEWCRHDQVQRFCPVCSPTARPAGLPAAPVVTLCGSMRFFAQMLAVAGRESAAGAIVLAPFTAVAPTVQSSVEGQVLKARLDALHRHKIDMADLVIVVSDASGYYGASTTGEVNYALAAGVPVSFRRIPTTRATSDITEAGQR